MNARNGEIIAASEGHETKDDCMNGIHAVQASCNAEIEDLTVTPKPVSIESVMEEAAVATVATAQTTMPTSSEMAKTKIELYKLPEQVPAGSVLHFKGKLSKGDAGIPDAYIRIHEHDRSFLLDGIWARGYTMEDGTFDLGCIAKAPHFWDDSARVFAQYDGDKEVKNLRAISKKS